MKLVGFLLMYFTFKDIQAASSGFQSIKLWENFGNKQFLLGNEALTWMEAQLMCRSLGGTLATIASKEEKDFVRKMTGVFPHSVWLGGTDMFAEGRWVWIDDFRRITYSHWYPGQPDGSTGENCVFWLNHGIGYYWHDISCKANFKFLCQRYKSSDTQQKDDKK